MQKSEEAMKNKSASNFFQQYTNCSGSNVREANFKIDDYDTVLVSGAIMNANNVDIITAAELIVDLSQEYPKAQQRGF